MAKHKKIKARLRRLELERDLLWDALDYTFCVLEQHNQELRAAGAGTFYPYMDRQPRWLDAWDKKLSPVSYWCEVWKGAALLDNVIKVTSEDGTHHWKIGRGKPAWWMNPSLGLDLESEHVDIDPALLR